MARKSSSVSGFTSLIRTTSNASLVGTATAMIRSASGRVVTGFAVGSETALAITAFSASTSWPDFGMVPGNRMPYWRSTAGSARWMLGAFSTATPYSLATASSPSFLAFSAISLALAASTS